MVGPHYRAFMNRPKSGIKRKVRLRAPYQCESPGPPGKNRGMANAKNKLTEEQVLAIFHDKRQQWQIADQYGIHQSNVSYIKSGRSWSWLTKAEFRPRTPTRTRT